MNGWLKEDAIEAREHCNGGGVHSAAGSDVLRRHWRRTLSPHASQGRPAGSYGQQATVSEPRFILDDPGEMLSGRIKNFTHMVE